MRRATYDRRQVICPNASLIGDCTRIVRPGYWITYHDGGSVHTARVLGRIVRTEPDGLEDCSGFLAVMRLHRECQSAGVRWVDPANVLSARAEPPRALLEWITGDAWVDTAHDIARLIAMAEHGTTHNQFIATRNDPEKPYNARAPYVDQFIL